MGTNIAKIQLSGKEVWLVGTGHVLKNSVRQVREAILEFQPDVVSVELDMARYLAKKSGKKPDYRKLGGPRAEKIFALVLHFMQQRAGETMGMAPGEDMFSAIRLAAKNRVPVALIDQDIRITLRKAKSQITFKEKITLIKALFLGFFELGNKQEIESVMDKRDELLTHADCRAANRAGCHQYDGEYGA